MTETKVSQFHAKNTYFILFIAALQSAALNFTTEFFPNTSFEYAFLVEFTIVATLFWQMAYPSKHFFRFLLAPLFIGAILGYCIANQAENTFRFIGYYYASSNLAFPSYLLSLASYIVLCLYLAYSHSGKIVAPYEDLFNYSWNSIFIIVLAAVFSGFCWLLLMLCQLLFSTLGINLFKTLFSTQPFVIVASCFFYAIGLALLRNQEKIINGLRQLLLTLCYYLLPPLAILGLAYLITLFIQHDFKVTDYRGLLITITALAIFFVNGVYQDGHNPKPYYSGIRFIVNLFLITLPVFPILSLQQPINNVGLYGFHPSLLLEILLTSLLALYALIYALSVFYFKSGWLYFISKGNIFMAYFLVIIFVAINTPSFDILKFSRDNQISRLRAGKLINTMENMHSPYLFRGDLSNTNLANKNFVKANLAYANLSNANLEHSNLTSASFIGADLSGANLSNSNLRLVDFNKAIFKNTRLDNADLSDAFGLDQSQLDQACGSNVVLPEKLSVEPCS